MAASTASACLRRLSPFVYSHNSSQASARSGMSGFCSTGHKKAQAGRLFCVGREIPRTRANHDVLARGRHLDLAIMLVAFFVEWIVAEHVLRAEFSRDLRESIGQ